MELVKITNAQKMPMACEFTRAATWNWTPFQACAIPLPGKLDTFSSAHLANERPNKRLPRKATPKEREPAQLGPRHATRSDPGCVNPALQRRPGLQARRTRKKQHQKLMCMLHSRCTLKTCVYIYIYIWARELFGAPWEAIHVQSSDPNVSNPSTIHLIQLYHLIQLVHLCTHISFANISTIYLNTSNL